MAFKFCEFSRFCLIWSRYILRVHSLFCCFLLCEKFTGNTRNPFKGIKVLRLDVEFSLRVRHCDVTNVWSKSAVTNMALSLKMCKRYATLVLMTIGNAFSVTKKWMCHTWTCLWKIVDNASCPIIIMYYSFQGRFLKFVKMFW